MSKELKTLKTSVSCGNTAAMREALKAVRMFLDGYTVNNLELRRMVDAALAAPARNCDRTNPEERYYQFCSSQRSCSACPHNGFGDLRCDGRWLLAPAAKAEGGKDERTKPEA